MQNMAFRRGAAEFTHVLQAHHVDIVEIQEFRCFLIRRDVVLGERPSHPRRIVISLFCVVYRQRQQSSGSVLRGYSRAPVGGERGNATLAGEDVSDHSDSTRERWLRLESWAVG